MTAPPTHTHLVRCGWGKLCHLQAKSSKKLDVGRAGRQVLGEEATGGSMGTSFTV